MAMQEGGVRVWAPAAALSSSELVRRSQIPLATLGWAHSCHVGNLACNNCRGCQKHSEVMSVLGFDR
jgi:7-cyano-7-deazaguanine synthase